jgi:putative GTP pyrophosphokinase
MKASSLPSKERKRIAAAVKIFVQHKGDFEWLAENAYALLSKHPRLRPLIHSMKWRLKDVESLRYKLIRKTIEADESVTEGKRVPEPITADNILHQIEDLAGVRILHLNTNQFRPINSAVLSILAAQQWVVTGPEANTWDDEFRDFFQSIGVKTIPRETLYTSVHYVLRANPESPFKCELQVRTLAEEIWGEVSHAISYPDETPSVACREQLKVLARLSSGCIRLVDSIFESEKEYKDSIANKRKRQSRKQ